MTDGNSVTCLVDGDEEVGLAAAGDDRMLSMEKGLSLLLPLILLELLSMMLILINTS